MRFFLDENFPKSATQLLRSSAHLVFDIRSTKHEGTDDKTIFEIAQKKKAIFLTTDRDFFHTIPYQFDFHYGVIIIALSQPNRKRILAKLRWALDNFDLNNFSNKIILMRDYRYSIIEK